MIEIDEPPDIQACAEHQVPIVWLWSPRAQAWKAFEPIDASTDSMRRHRCEFHGDPAPSWRQRELRTEPDPSVIASTYAGVALARQAIEAATTKETTPCSD